MEQSSGKDSRGMSGVSHRRVQEVSGKNRCMGVDKDTKTKVTKTTHGNRFIRTQVDPRT